MALFAAAFAETIIEGVEFFIEGVQAGPEIAAGIGTITGGEVLKRSYDNSMGEPPNKVARMEADSAGAEEAEKNEFGGGQGKLGTMQIARPINPVKRVFNVPLTRTIEVPFYGDSEGSFLVLPYTLLETYLFSGNAFVNAVNFLEQKGGNFYVKAMSMGLSNFMPISEELRALGGSTIKTDIISNSYAHIGFLQRNEFAIPQREDSTWKDLTRNGIHTNFGYNEVTDETYDIITNALQGRQILTPGAVANFNFKPWNPIYGYQPLTNVGAPNIHQMTAGVKAAVYPNQNMPINLNSTYSAMEGNLVANGGIKNGTLPIDGAFNQPPLVIAMANLQRNALAENSGTPLKIRGSFLLHSNITFEQVFAPGNASRGAQGIVTGWVMEELDHSLITDYRDIFPVTVNH